MALNTQTRSLVQCAHTSETMTSASQCPRANAGHSSQNLKRRSMPNKSGTDAKEVSLLGSPDELVTCRSRSQGAGARLCGGASRISWLRCARSYVLLCTHAPSLYRCQRQILLTPKRHAPSLY
eukprot:3220707-Rhodomonas_salina.3